MQALVRGPGAGPSGRTENFKILFGSTCVNPNIALRLGTSPRGADGEDLLSNNSGPDDPEGSLSSWRNRQLAPFASREFWCERLGGHSGQRFGHSVVLVHWKLSIRLMEVDPSTME